MFTITPTIHQCDESGEYFIRYTPSLKPDCTASGNLTFAAWSVALHAPEEEHKEATNNALDSMAKTLRRFSEIAADSVRKEPNA